LEALDDGLILHVFQLGQGSDRRGMIEQEGRLLEQFLDLRLDDAVEDLRARRLLARVDAELLRQLHQAFAVEAFSVQYVVDRLAGAIFPNLGKIEAAKR